MHSMRLAGALLFLLAMFSPAGAAENPTYGNWPWPVALDYIETTASTVGSSCRLWLEKYGSNSYRLKKRCGVNATASGITLNDYSFPWSGTWEPATFSNCGTHGAIRRYKDGNGALIADAACPSNGNSIFAGQTVTNQDNLNSWPGDDKTIHNSYGVTCTGATIAAGAIIGQVVGGAALQWSLLAPYIRDTSVAANTESATCRAADSLVMDFGPIVSDCTSTGTVVLRVNGRTASAASCNCIPVGFAIGAAPVNNVCTYYNITGSPANLGTDTEAVGTQVERPGARFTNEDLAQFPSGETGYPVLGSDPNGGMGDGYGLPGAGGNVPGTTSTGPGGTGGGGGTGGTGTCTSTNCNDDGTEDAGIVPSAPVYDGDIETPESENWVQAITDFIGDSPLGGLLGGAEMTTTSSTCVITGGSIHGASMSFDICSIPGMDLFAPVLIALAHLTAFFIVWRN